MELEVRRELLQIIQLDSFVMTHAFAAVICKSVLLEHSEISKRVKYLGLHISGGIGNRCF